MTSNEFPSFYRWIICWPFAADYSRKFISSNTLTHSSSWKLTKTGRQSVFLKKLKLPCKQDCLRKLGSLSRAQADIIMDLHSLHRLRHPNVVRLLAVQQLQSCEFDVYFEFVDGQSLQELMDSIHTGLEVDRARLYLRQICSALQEMHSNVDKIFHCDLNSSNVLLSKGLDSVKLTGFNLLVRMTQFATNDPKAAAQLQSTLVASVPFMSPELCDPKTDAQHLNEQADIWAFGCVLYHMLEGRCPYFDSEATQIAERVFRFGAPSLSPGCDESGADLYKKCTQFDPRLRSTADEISGHPFFHPEPPLCPQPPHLSHPSPPAFNDGSGQCGGISFTIQDAT